MVHQMYKPGYPGGLEPWFYDFPYIGNVMIPSDFHSIIFQSRRKTTNQIQPVYSTDSSLQGKGKGKGKQLKVDDALKVANPTKPCWLAG
jgi:hypothetical protein